MTMKLFSILIFIFALSSSAFAGDASIYTRITDWYSDNLNYGTVTLLMTIESTFIPFPSEVIVPPAAYKALQADAGLNIILVVLFATLGALLGALINFYLAKFLGRPIIYKFADSRLGRMCLLDSQKIVQAEAYFRKHGAISTFIGRFIPVIRQLISIPAGIAGMKLRPFILFTALGAFLWNVVLALLGVLAHGQSDVIQKYNTELSMIIVGVAGLFICYVLYKGIRGRKKTDSR
ncbi:membrane protein DedA, SNARE-associated domain [Fibrobacter intestinalis]|uniref:Membrane protein DedA, SNARE-associated domain n=2 Tax=Fibrobacteraceae TaxID=204431 RepID=A0A1T4JTW1_9BACT|nr:membrane protein DedA with SNARE-associated domain [Fibrobacter sp. NR9]SJZ33652.1 membrane protein DedA, SNARE-associated domain [Fibrobacter intestinalis]